MGSEQLENGNHTLTPKFRLNLLQTFFSWPNFNQDPVSLLLNRNRTWTSISIFIELSFSKTPAVRWENPMLSMGTLVSTKLLALHPPGGSVAEATCNKVLLGKDHPAPCPHSSVSHWPISPALLLSCEPRFPLLLGMEPILHRGLFPLITITPLQSVFISTTIQRWFSLAPPPPYRGCNSYTPLERRSHLEIKSITNPRKVEKLQKKC